MLRGKAVEMGKHVSHVGILNARELAKQFDRLEKNAEKAVNHTVKDFKSKAPGWVSWEVRQTYGIKDQEIRPKTEAGKARKVKYAGNVYASGDTLETVTLTYRGRVLTPTHFDMRPKEFDKTYYTISAEIKDGVRKKIGGRKALTKKQKQNIGRNFTKQGKRHARREPIILVHTGAKGEDKVSHIPMRIKKNGKFEKFLTVSLPQMVGERLPDGTVKGNKKVRDRIDKKIAAEMEERLQHNVERFMKV